MGDPSNDRENGYGAYQKTPPANQPAGVANVPMAHIPLPNMAESLKTHAMQALCLGSSNVDSVYYQAWKRIAPRLNHQYSHIFNKALSKVTFRLRALVYKYRYGLLATLKNLFRWKKALSPTCPLCGQPDGGHHAVSACPALSKGAAKRHNDAGTILMRAISQGARGADLVMTDVGMRQRASGEDMPASAHTTRIPVECLPQEMPDVVRREVSARCRPDALLFNTDHEGRRHYDIVEIKYCRDTDPELQEHRAKEQHEDLVAMIREHDPQAQVELHIILFGVSGSILITITRVMKETGGCTTNHRPGGGGRRATFWEEGRGKSRI